MYTFYPLENINTVDVHTGFYFVAATIVVVWVIALFNCLDDLEGFGWVTSILLVLLGVSALISWTSGEIKVYVNTPVEATFVSFAPEGYNETRHVGKTVRHVDVHEMYVVYRVNDENIIVRAQDGVAYPETAILYKN